MQVTPTAADDAGYWVAVYKQTRAKVCSLTDAHAQSTRKREDEAFAAALLLLTTDLLTNP